MVRPESVEEVAEGPAAPVGPTVNELRSKLLREKPVMVVPKVTVEGVQDTSAVPSWFDEAAIDVGPGGVGPDCAEIGDREPEGRIGRHREFQRSGGSAAIDGPLGLPVPRCRTSACRDRAAVVLDSR